MQRIIITKKGTEIQNQIKDLVRKEETQFLTSLHKDDEQLQKLRYDEYRQFLLSKPNAQDQLQKYSSLVQNRLGSPDQIQTYLETKVGTSSNVKAKFIQRQLEKASVSIYKNSFQEKNVSRSLPFLDFRQTQFLKGKYDKPFKQHGIFQLQLDHQHKFIFTPKYKVLKAQPPQTVETGSKRVTQMMFQESKLERMINKFDKFDRGTADQPRFDEVYRRDVLSEPKFLRDLYKDENETRVESLQELNARLMDQMSILDYHTSIKTRQRQVLSELHYTRYGKYWHTKKFPGNIIQKSSKPETAEQEQK